MATRNIIAIVILQLVMLFTSSFALDCNFKLLDMRADHFNNQVWTQSELHTTSSEIESSLDFVYSKEATKVRTKAFAVLCEAGVKRMDIVRGSKIGNQAAINFNVLLNGFKEIYATREGTKQVAVSFLLEAILDKSSPTLKRLERSLKNSQKNSEQSSKKLDCFLKADTSQPLLPSSNFVVF